MPQRNRKRVMPKDRNCLGLLPRSLACMLVLGWQAIYCALPQPSIPPLQLTAQPFITAADPHNSNGHFTGLIEAAMTDKAGNLYATGYGTYMGNVTTARATIGQVNAHTADVHVWYQDTTLNSWMNGARMLRHPTRSSQTIALFTDVLNHRVIQVDINSDGRVARSSQLCADPRMLQPNDLAVSPNGQHVYLTGMRGNDTHGQGDLWHCGPSGAEPIVTADSGALGRTNGIEVSPDGSVLYVSEAVGGWTPSSSRVWRYALDPDSGAVIERLGLLADFGRLDGSGSVDVDGMRCDVDGALYVTRATAGEVVKLSPDGEVLARIQTSFGRPRNLELGGADGRTLYIVGPCDPVDQADVQSAGCVDTVRVEQPGRAWSAL